MAKCKKCGMELAENVKFCPNCGTPNEPNPVEVKVETSNTVTPFGVVGLVLACISMFLNFVVYSFAIPLLLFGIPAIVFSSIGLADKKHKIKGVAVAGLIISILACIIAFIAPTFLKYVAAVKAN